MRALPRPISPRPPIARKRPTNAIWQKMERERRGTRSSISIWTDSKMQKRTKLHLKKTSVQLRKTRQTTQTSTIQKMIEACQFLKQLRNSSNNPNRHKIQFGQGLVDCSNTLLQHKFVSQTQRCLFASNPPRPAPPVKHQQQPTQLPRPTSPVTHQQQPTQPPRPTPPVTYQQQPTQPTRPTPPVTHQQQPTQPPRSTPVTSQPSRQPLPTDSLNSTLEEEGKPLSAVEKYMKSLR